MFIEKCDKTFDKKTFLVIMKICFILQTKQKQNGKYKKYFRAWRFRQRKWWISGSIKK